MMWFKNKVTPKPQWWEMYKFSCINFTAEDKIFLSSYTEESLNKILGDEYFINSRYKIHLDEYLKGVYHFINTGEKKYFYTYGQDTHQLRERLRIFLSDFKAKVEAKQ